MIVVRPLGPPDISEVLRVQRGAYVAELNEPAEAFAAKASAFPPGALGAFEGGALVGYVFSHPWALGEVAPLDAGSLRLPERPDCLYIHDLAVSPSHRGEGLAGRLLDEAVSLARGRGLPALALVAVQGSKGFWQRHGFSIRFALEYRPGVLASYMVRHLTDGPDPEPRG